MDPQKITGITLIALAMAVCSCTAPDNESSRTAAQDSIRVQKKVSGDNSGSYKTSDQMEQRWDSSHVAPSK
ncbi:MAG: hypothetical protein ABI373_08265 [Flavobacteriales bacterium]